jgi:hypothetical protein
MEHDSEQMMGQTGYRRMADTFPKPAVPVIRDEKNRPGLAQFS